MGQQLSDDEAMLDRQVAAARAFNRFYTRQIGVLAEGILRSDFTLAEARVLYELANRPASTAARLCEDLLLDAGYLSRILKKFEAQGLVSRTASGTDARQSELRLTEAGHAAFAPLDRLSQDDMAALIRPLPPPDRVRLVEAMATIRQALGDGNEPAPPYVLRPHRPGDIGWVIHRQAALYHREYGWNDEFEALAAEICAGFLRTFDPKHEHCWIAERDGAIVGSVFLVRDGDSVAKLRLLYVEPSARGLGLGRHLVDECIRFARGHGYVTLTLWTNDVLVAARKLYEAAGFTLVDEDPHHAFGKDLVGQNWSLAL